MASSVWQIAEHLATLRAGALSGSLDVSDPAGGLLIDQVAGARIPPSAIFQILLSIPPGAADSSAVDCFVRGTDLVATYAETAARQFRAQVYWRNSEQATDDEVAATVELILSVQTSLLDSDPTISVGSLLAVSEAHRLSDADSADFKPCGAEAQEIAFEPATGPGCFLFRQQSSPSYVEMVHPADFRQATLTFHGSPVGKFALAHRLFHRRLEKGVILRSRLRGVFVPHDRDMELAAAEYRRFAASEPPLTA
jgi:hypothetical protein